MTLGGAPEHAGGGHHRQAVGREVEHLRPGILHEAPDDPHPPPHHPLLCRLPQELPHTLSAIEEILTFADVIIFCSDVGVGESEDTLELDS